MVCDSYFEFLWKWKDLHLILLFRKDNATLEEAAKDYAKSKPMNFDFNMRAYYLNFFYIYNTKK
jgi:hypothetical protein